MVVKFLAPSTSFAAIGYNFDKVATGNAELTLAANFGALEGLDQPRSKDYFNYLEFFSLPNHRVHDKQLHVAISAEGESFDKHQLTAIATLWLAQMGYSKNPYLIFFHKDADNNHVHIVSTRIGPDGRKVNSGFEHIRGLAAMNKIIGIDEKVSVTSDIEKALRYNFTTLPQLKNLFETMGYKFENNTLIKFGKKLAQVPPEKIVSHTPPENRRSQLKGIFQRYHEELPHKEMVDYLRKKLGIQIVFHSAEGHAEPYGYTVIDHAQKNIFKGSQIMPIKELLSVAPIAQQSFTGSKPSKASLESTASIAIDQDTPVRIHIASDINDEAIHGRRRRKKARGTQR